MKLLKKGAGIALVIVKICGDIQENIEMGN
jgi:hypothetical protein